MNRCRRTAIALLCLIVIAGSSFAFEKGGDYSFLEGLTLIVLDTDDIASLHTARRLVHSYGGQVAIMSPPSLLIGWIPFDVRDQLAAEAGIREVYFTEVLPGEIPGADARTRAMVSFYNAAVNGEIAARQEPRIDDTAAGQQPERRPDSFDPPALEYDAYLENLRGAGLDVQSLRDRGMLPTDTDETILANSDDMSGTAALTVFFVESDGSGADPDLYTWTPEHMQAYLDAVASGLAWWSTKAAQHTGCWVTWLINWVSGADPRAQQWTEPILHSSSWQSTWINEIMLNMGYTVAALLLSNGSILLGIHSLQPATGTVVLSRRRHRVCVSRRPVHSAAVPVG
jgi:hypothetical protein